MNAAEKILEELKTPEGKDKIRKLAEDYKKEIEEKERQMKTLIQDESYIQWLEKFTNKNAGFYDDDWLYCPEKISEEDLKKVEKLYLFYRIIDKYARENYIYPTPTDFGNYYSVSYNNIGFLIGIMVGQGTTFNCERTTVGEDFIKFEDIQNNKKQVKTDIINQKLQLLANLIETIAEEDVPLRAIEDTTEQSLQRLVKKRKKNN